MGHLSFGADSIMTPPMGRQTRHLTVTVDGDDRDATWKQAVGICVAGHDIGEGDEVEIEGTPHAVIEMRRMVMEGERLTLITGARELE